MVSMKYSIITTTTLALCINLIACKSDTHERERLLAIESRVDSIAQQNAELQAFKDSVAKPTASISNSSSGIDLSDPEVQKAVTDGLMNMLNTPRYIFGILTIVRENLKPNPYYRRST